jgi:hypothetical protein
MLHKRLLACGVAAAVWHGAMLVFIPMLWPGYSSTSQTISELSAIGAPTRPLWVGCGIVYTLLIIAFGWGVWKSAQETRKLRVVGAVLIVTGLLALAWPPMHLRGAELTLTDTLHIVWTAITLVGMLLAIGFGAAAFGAGFRLYSIVTLTVWAVFGTLTGLDGPRVAANLPTPWVGLWERINAGAYLVWLAVFAVAMLRRTVATPAATVQVPMSQRVLTRTL